MKTTFVILLFVSFLFFTALGQNFDAELVKTTTDIVVSNDKLIKNESFEIKINNRNGEKFSKVSIPYSKTIKVKKIDAFLKNSEGETIRKLKNDEITVRSDISHFSLYEDDFVKEFTLKHNVFPYYVCYSYQIEESEFIHIENWIPILDTEIPTQKAELSLTIPSDYSFRFKNQFIDEPTIDVANKTKKYNWKATYYQKLKSEKLSPPIIDFLPAVIIIPDEFKYVIQGNFEDWKGYVNWASQLIKNINTLTENEKIIVKSKISGVENETEKIKTLYHYLQDNTRYINVSINKGGVKPYPASYVCDNKYGDCKALTNYFMSVLEFIGIKSYYTIIYGGEPNRKIDKDFASDKFNHIILYVPLKNDTIWLDCTSKGPFDYLGTFTQNRDALVVDNVNGGLLRTPELKPNDVLEKRNITITQENNKPTKILFDNNFRGKMFDMIRQLENSYNNQEKDNILRNYIIEDGFEMIDYQINRINRDDKDIQLTYQATSNNIYKKYGNELVLSNIKFDIPQIETPTERKLPIQIDYPIFKIDTVNYNIPEGYILSNKLQDISMSESPYGHYSIHFQQKDNSIQVIKKMLINSGIYPLNEYQNFYDFCNKILNFENTKHIILTTKE